MGFLQALRLMPKAGNLTSTAVVSPWSQGSLNTIVWQDIMGDDVVAPLTREVAMRVPAVSKARNLICATAMRFPLVAMDVNGKLPNDQQPSWMYRTDGAVSPQMRLCWTLDDLIFRGYALWQVVRGSEGQILSAERVPPEWTTITPEGAILINGRAVGAREVIYFPSHTDPLLMAAAVTIRSAIKTDAAVERRASTPIPLVEIHDTDADTPLKKSEALGLVTDYNKSRRDPEGATVFTPARIELKVHGDKADSGALVEARNAARLDIANHTGLPASMLEGSSAGASLTYVTTEGKRSELIEYGVLPWIEDVTSRLSLDDVVPRGIRSALDLDALVTPNPSATGAELQD